MKRTIAIVAGGDSSEHDVSLRSAEGIMSFMDKDKYDCFVVEIKAGRWTVAYKDENCHIDRNDFSFTASDGKHEFERTESYKAILTSSESPTPPATYSWSL